MQNTSLAPICLFAYQRLEHLQLTIEALQKNEGAQNSDLFIFSDGPKNKSAEEGVKKVRDFARGINGFQSVKVVERKENWGLAKNIIHGVTEIVSQFGKVIVVEDDLVTSPYFLNYMNDGLNRFENEDQIISIHGYIYPVEVELPETVLIKGADCWGWATWKRGWDLFNPDGGKLLAELTQKNLTREFNFKHTYPYKKMLVDQIEGRNNSWAIRWYASAFLAGKFTIYPGKSLVRNIGMDGSGTHQDADTAMEVQISSKPITRWPESICENAQARKAIEKFFYRALDRNPIKRFLKKVRLWIT